MTHRNKTLDGAAAPNLNLLDPTVQACPWAAYQVMRDSPGIFKDPATGYFIVTRYDDLRRVLNDDHTFNAGHPDRLGKPWLQTPSGRKLLKKWEEEGWAPEDHLQDLSGEAHGQIRSTMSWAFTGQRIREMESVAAQKARELVDRFINDQTCEWVEQFAAPLPLHVIGKQTGINDEHLPMILECVDSYVSLTGMMDTEEQAFIHLNRIIACQHFFQEMIQQFRRAPDGSLISDLVNADIPGQSRKFTDCELHSHILSALFVAGAETTRNALSEGMRVLIENNDIWVRLKADPFGYSKIFTEEILRLHSPAQGLFKYAQRDTELSGTEIPRGSIVITRYGSANRDERHFDDPATFNPERRGLTTHLAFGAGAHHCLGSQLARAEIRQAFRHVAERFASIRFSDLQKEFHYHPHFALRGLVSLSIEFVPTIRGQ